MRKNIASLLSKGNLTPKERYLLLVADIVSYETEGKKFLTDTDKHALTDGWTPANNGEVAEYNRYAEGWRHAVFAEMDAQTTYLKATNNLLRAGRLIDMMFRIKGDNLQTLNFYKKLYADKDEALKFVIQNSGQELDYVIYRYAFESLSEPIKKDMLALYPDAKTEMNYLNEEQIIAELLNGKTDLTKEAREKLGELIAEKSYNGLEGENEFDYFYADIYVLDLIKKWADKNKINYEPSDKDLSEAENKQKQASNASQLIAGDKSLDKKIRKDNLEREILTTKIKEYAEKHKTTIEAIIIEAFKSGFDKGEISEPIVLSDSTATINNIKTKLPHKELFKEWVKAKTKAEQTIQELIDKGELKIRERTEEIKTIRSAVRQWIKYDKDLDFKENPSLKRTLKLITGESLYNLKGDYTFANDFKKQAEDLEGIGGLSLFLRNSKFLQSYAILLEFLELYKRISKVYEIDLTYKVKGWIADLKQDIESLNSEIVLATDTQSIESYRKNGVAFLNNTFIGDMLINIEDIKPTKEKQDTGGLYYTDLERYYTEFKKMFGDNF